MVMLSVDETPFTAIKSAMHVDGLEALEIMLRAQASTLPWTNGLEPELEGFVIDCIPGIEIGTAFCLMG